MRPPRPPSPTPAPTATIVPWWIRVAVALVPVLGAAYFLTGSLASSHRLGFPMDDPYIHFQFARNLADGHGFSFNPGVPVPGATSPLWVVLLAAGHAVGAPIEPLAVALGVLAASAAALLTLEVGVAAGLPLALAVLAGLAVGATGRFVWASLSGMETCLAAALSLAAVRLALPLDAESGARRAALAGAVAGLAANARPEMLLLGPILAGLIGLRDRSARTWRVAALHLAAFLATLVPYAAFCLATSGRPFPNTFYAKSLLPLSETGLDLGSLRAQYLPEVVGWAWRDHWMLGVLLVPGLVWWVTRRPWPRARLAIAAWPLAFWVYAWWLCPRHFSLSRYTIPLVPFEALLAMGALAWVAGRWRARAARDVLVAAAAVSRVVDTSISGPEIRQLYALNVDTIGHMQVAMGEWVASHLPPDARVATNDVGAITWYGRRPCIDTFGLVTSDFITHELAWRRSHGTISYEEALPSFLRRVRPDYCILFPSWYPRLVHESWLEPIHEIDYPNTTGGGDQLVVFRVVATPPERLVQAAP